MIYNRHLYNSALYNAGREEAGAIIKSIIQAHTGPHIRAAVGTSQGVSFISDFVITEGAVRKPPSSYSFPDLSALIKAVQTGSKDLGSDIFGISFKDLPAAIYPSNRIPDLPAIIRVLSSSNLPAAIAGFLATSDLPAIIINTARDLPGIILGQDAPYLFAKISVQPPSDLGARIWSPTDLRAIINFPPYIDLPTSIGAHPPADLPGSIYPSDRIPNLLAWVKTNVSDIADIISYLNTLSSSSGDLGASIFGGYADFDLQAVITSAGGYKDLPTFLRSFASASSDLKTTIGIEIGNTADLPAAVGFFGAKNLPAQISSLGIGIQDRFLPAFIQGLTFSALAASINSTGSFSNLTAQLSARPFIFDLPATLTVSETIITALFTITTLSSRNLKATIGVPQCEGGSGIKDLLASTVAQNKGDLSAKILSFIDADLGAKINDPSVIYHLDTVQFSYAPYRPRDNRTFYVSDTITISYGPFRGATLPATIFGESPRVDLPATLTASIVLPRVVPSVSRILAADLRRPEVLNIQEVRLELEGVLADFLYVNNTSDAFILDYNQTWKINVSSFKSIAAELFGDFASARICRLGRVSSYYTLDEAVRACIDAVLGLNGETNLGATLSAVGGIGSLSARIEITTIFSDLSARAERVFPSDITASISSQGAFGDLGALLAGSSSTSSDLSASVDPEAQADLGASVVGT